jgi:arsenite methyltransferase
MAAASDRWSEWLLGRRDGGDERQRAVSVGHLAGVRSRVLANAGPLDGATLLDVGTGDGLIGLEALERVRPAGEVIFSDISEALLEHTRAAVGLRGEAERASFVVTGAPTVREAVEAALGENEQRRFLDALGAAIAERRCVRRSALAYVTAYKAD